MQVAVEPYSPGGVDEIRALQQRVQVLEQQWKTAPAVNSLNMVVFSGELDKLLAAFTIATGAGACGMSVSLFCTFWGTVALKKSGPQSASKPWVERLFGWLLPGGLQKRRLSHLDFGGFGRRMMTLEMKKKRIADLPTLLDLAGELGVQIYVCEMSMSLMGIRKEELIDYPHLRYCGVAYFLDLASRSNTTLFI
jgi:peroxiredoxin family protein